MAPEILCHLHGDWRLKVVHGAQVIVFAAEYEFFALKGFDALAQDIQFFNFAYGRRQGRKTRNPSRRERNMEELLIRPTEDTPWYDDRVAGVLKNNEIPVEDTEAEPSQYSPKQIYDYLDQKVYKQTEAKRRLPS